MTPVTVTVNGVPVQVGRGEQVPYKQNGRVFVPLRYVAEAMGATVAWHQKENAAAIQKGDRYMVAWPNVATIIANGWAFALEAPARLIEGRIYVPIRFAVEALGGSVTWNDDTQSANVLPEPARFEPAAAASLATGVINSIASEFRVCDHLLCLDRQKLLLHTTPAIWELAYAHIDTANDILKAVREVGDRVFVRNGKLYLAKAAAAGLALGAAVGEVTNDWAGFVETLNSVGLVVTKVPPIAVAPAVVIGVLSIADTGGMPGDEEAELIKQANAVMAAAAAAGQVAANYKPDNWNVCFLRQGDIVWGGLPGPSPFFTDTATVTASQFLASVLFRMIQVPPNPEYGGWRTHVSPYLVLTNQMVACGKVSANPTAVIAMYGLINNGPGGGQQYFIPNWRTSLQEMEPQPLKDWKVPDWDALRVIGGN